MKICHAQIEGLEKNASQRGYPHNPHCPHVTSSGCSNLFDFSIGALWKSSCFFLVNSDADTSGLPLILEEWKLLEVLPVRTFYSQKCKIQFVCVKEFMCLVQALKFYYATSSNQFLTENVQNTNIIFTI